MFLKRFEEKYDVTRIGSGPCTVQCAIDAEYQIILHSYERNSVQREDEDRTQAIRFHLILNYKPKVDGISIVHLNYDRNKFESQLGPIGEQIKSLLTEVQRGWGRSTLDTRNSPQGPSLASTGGQPKSPFNDFSPLSPAGISLANLCLEPRADKSDLILRQLRIACEVAGAELTSMTESEERDHGIPKDVISGQYAGTKFRVSIHGFSNGDINLEQLYAVWKEPKNASKMSLPGIGFLVNVLDAMIASIKYFLLLQDKSILDR